MSIEGLDKDELVDAHAVVEAVAPDVPGVPQIELRVTRGEYVTVEIDPDMPPPDGWCLCRVDRDGEPATRGLVPWRFLVSAAHAELDAAQAATAEAAARAEAEARAREAAESHVQQLAEEKAAQAQSKLSETDVEATRHVAPARRKP